MQRDQKSSWSIMENAPRDAMLADAKSAISKELDGHEAKVARHYIEFDGYYQGVGGTHLMLFEPGQAPDELDAPPAALAELRAAGMQRLTDAVTEPAEICPGDHVVDAGCGYGAVAMQLARKHDCRVTGVNFVHHQLEHAKDQAERAGLAGQVVFRRANCSQALPFEDASVDVVVCMEAACHFSDRSRFLREVNRILKPGGRLALEDFMEPDGPVSEACRKQIDRFCRGWSLHSLESRTSYTRKLTATGLDLVEYAGFSGADAYNGRVAEVNRRNSLLQLLIGSDPWRAEWHLAWATTASAWRHGHILHERFLARKP